jgi:hypothetical protein
LKGTAIRFGNGVIDRLLRVDSHRVLNGGQVAESGGGDVIAELLNVIEQMSTAGAASGRVDYEGMKENPVYRRYRRVVARLRQFDPSSLGSREEKLAFWINLYNCLVVDAVITLGIRATIWEGGKGFFRKIAYVVGGCRYSADDIEHGILRGNRRHPAIPWPQFGPGDPRLRQTIVPIEVRLHFTLVCASRSCPINTVYHPSELEGELEMAASTFVNGGGVMVSPETAKVSLSRIFRWFQSDFGGRSGVIEFILRYLIDGPEKDFLRKEAHRIGMVFQPYDWSLNR